MIVGVALVSVGYILLLLVELLPTGLWAGWLFATNALVFLGGALWVVNGLPFLAGVTTAEVRDHAFSVRAALFPLAAFAGSLVGGFLPGLLAARMGLSLDGPGPYRYTLLIAAVAYGVVALPALLATREVSGAAREQTLSNSGGAPYGPITIMALTNLLVSSGSAMTSVFLNVYLDAGLQAPASLIGTLTAVGSLVGVPAALAAPLVMARCGKGRTVVLGYLGVFLSLLPLALLPHWGATGLGLAGLTAASAIAGAAYTIYGQEIVSPHWRALMSGASLLAWGLSSSLVSFAGGYLIEALGYSGFFLLGAGLTALGALLFAAYFCSPRGEFTRISDSVEIA
jgi:predicted MFS family arabinose efflux permease